MSWISSSKVRGITRHFRVLVDLVSERNSFNAPSISQFKAVDLDSKWEIWISDLPVCIVIL